MAKYYGWKKGPVREKPFKYTKPHHLIAKLPSLVDLEPQCPEVYNQSDLGACTSHAAAALAQFLMMKLGLPNYIPARLAIYWWNRFQEGTVDKDSGASLHDAMNTLVKFGVPHEDIWPYDTKNFVTKPEKPVWSDGYWHSVEKGLAVEQDITTIKTCLAEGYPLIFGFMVFESFESEAVATTGIMPIPTVLEQVLGGHAVMAVGYNDETQMVKVRNSWGNKWGKNGYFYMPYNFISCPLVADDFWTARNFVRFKN